jgi:hypothetical protein
VIDPCVRRASQAKNVASGFEISLSQDTIVCFYSLEIMPYNLFQSVILANVGVEKFYKIKFANRF